MITDQNEEWRRNPAAFEAHLRTLKKDQRYRAWKTYGKGNDIGVNGNPTYLNHYEDQLLVSTILEKEKEGLHFSYEGIENLVCIFFYLSVSCILHLLSILGKSNQGTV
jgi:hypothetical protein